MKKYIIPMVMLLLLLISSTALAAYQRTADNTVAAYRNEALTQRTGNERVDKGDVVTVLQETDRAYYVRYPVKNGTKDRWVPKNIFNAQARSVSQPSNTVTINDGWYRIQPMHDLRRSLDALGQQIGSGNNVHMWTSVDADQQKFYLQNRGNGFFSLQSAYGSRLFVTADGDRAGANLYTSPWNGSDNQLFRLISTGKGAYYVMSKAGSNLIFDCAGGGQKDGTNVGLWAKDNDTVGWYKWKFTSVNANATTTGSQQESKTAWINTQSQNLNLRANPNGTIIGKLAKGTQVTVLETGSNGWTKVRTASGQIGYVSSQYVSFDSSPVVPSTSDTISSNDVREKLMNAIFHSQGARISCDFDGYKNTNGRHEGIDVVLTHKAPVYAVISGEITKAGGGSYNTFAIYDSANNKTVVYLHFSAIANGMYVGRHVEKGELIGYQGNTGAPQGSHVHIEVRDGKRTAAAKSVNDPTLDNPNPYDYWNRVL